MAYFPVDRWDSQARTWDATVTNKNFPHYFYYYEADLYITDLLKTSHLALELGAGTCGSTVNHASKDHRIVAIDYSREMLVTGREKLEKAGCEEFVDIIVGDICHLPFRESSFDSVFSRGVTICYAADPEKLAKEVHRALSTDGRLGLDFMNKSGQSKRKITRLEQIKGETYYVEMFSEDGKQKRIGYQLPKSIDFSSVPQTEDPFSNPLSKLGGLKLEDLPREEWWAKLYAPSEIRQLVRDAGFKGSKMYPLGCFARGLTNPTIQQFLINNREHLSAIQKEMAGVFRLDKAVHVFLTAEKNIDGLRS